MNGAEQIADAGEPEAQEGALERHAGTIISLAFHGCFFALLYTASPLGGAAGSGAEPPPIKIALKDLVPEADAPPEPSAETIAALKALAEEEPEQEPAAPSPPEPAAPPPPPQFAPAAATQGPEVKPEPEPKPQEEPRGKPDGSDEGGTAEGTLKPGEAAPAPPESPAPESPLESAQPPIDESPTGELARSEAAALATELKTKRAQLEHANQELARKGSDAVAERLQAAQIKVQSRKWLTTTAGAKEGVIRSIKTSDVPPSVAQQVLSKYGIKIGLVDMRAGAGGGSGYGFLNQAQTSAGTYVSGAGRGKVEVFSYGQAAVGRMMQLEQQALAERGLDPAKTRVIEIEYGIVQTSKGYDLGVKRLESVPVMIESK